MGVGRRAWLAVVQSEGGITVIRALIFGSGRYAVICDIQPLRNSRAAASSRNPVARLLASPALVQRGPSTFEVPRIRRPGGTVGPVTSPERRVSILVDIRAALKPFGARHLTCAPHRVHSEVPVVDRNRSVERAWRQSRTKMSPG